jgi:hypothetical protein
MHSASEIKFAHHTATDAGSDAKYISDPDCMDAGSVAKYISDPDSRGVAPPTPVGRVK